MSQENNINRQIKSTKKKNKDQLQFKPEQNQPNIKSILPKTRMSSMSKKEVQKGKPDLVTPSSSSSSKKRELSSPPDQAPAKKMNTNDSTANLNVGSAGKPEDLEEKRTASRESNEKEQIKAKLSPELNYL